MAQLIITIPDALVPRIQTAFAATYHYAATINGAPNPETVGQFTQRMIRTSVKEVVAAYEAQQAGDTARVAALATAATEITLS